MVSGFPAIPGAFDSVGGIAYSNVPVNVRWKEGSVIEDEGGI